MHRKPRDYDIATNAGTAELLELFQRNGIRAVNKGKRCGTVSLIFSGADVEITPFRVESGYFDHRRPAEVVFVESIEEDLSRRDFTVNALAMKTAFHMKDII